MALLADDAADRVQQLLLVSERLCELIQAETDQIKARKPPLAGALADEKARYANAYRLELARIKQDPSMVAGAPPEMLTRLRKQTVKLQDVLATHELELGAVKLITEGLAQVMAEEVARQRGGARNYGATGGIETPGGPIPVAIDRKA